MTAASWLPVPGGTLFGSTEGSDEFNTPALDTSIWTFVNPLNDATLTLTGTAASIQVPGGKNHFTWTGTNSAPRLMQAAADTDFEIEAKFDSPLTKAFQTQGLRIEQDLGNSLSAQLHYTGTTRELTYAHVVNGVIGTQEAAPLPGGTPMYLRVRRTGETWAISYSTDGQQWQQVFSTTRAMTVTAFGAFVGNFNPTSSKSPAHVGVIDYFRKTTLPSGGVTIGVPPEIEVHPAPVSVTAPAATTFTVSATGEGPFTYQWRRNGTPVGGATAATYTLAPTA
ncbi:MAG TPA: DUF1349 domain-containing protein, partial [Mycobacterium sp.]|nr:DUF1349 domain-containing protein [Mycobacterium sp.]